MNEERLEMVRNATFGFRALFYLVTPAETSPKTLETVPDIVNTSFPGFFTLILIELACSLMKGTKSYQFNDALTSMSAGVMSRLPDLFMHTIELVSYVWFYERFHVFEMPLDSVWTWIFTMLAFDCGYYWFHRAAHEINILWAIHQTHHSSEYYNLSTALRQAVLQKYGSFVFYLPIALVVPPPMFAMHVQLNLIYQFWIHTEQVGRLGPLEWIFNTASHHRVHHGRNPYCVDKNYAGFLIIWDRMFGTFQPELDEEKVVYGLIHNIKNFDAIHVQLIAFYDIYRKLAIILRSKKTIGMEKVKNVFKALFYGPGWFPRKPNFRLGDPKDLPPIEANPKRHNPPLPTWVGIYCLVHFVIASITFSLVTEIPGRPFEVNAGIFLGYMASAISFGNLFNLRRIAPYFELARSVIFAVYLVPLIAISLNVVALKLPFQILFGLSALPWLFLKARKEDKQSIETTKPTKTE